MHSIQNIGSGLKRLTQDRTWLVIFIGSGLEWKPQRQVAADTRELHGIDQPTQELCHPSDDGFLRLAESFHRKDSVGKIQEFATTAGDPPRGNLNAP